MQSIIVFALCLFTITSCSVTRPKKVFYDLNNAEELFKEFIQKYDKTYYNDGEYQMRLGIFTESLKYCNEMESEDHGLCGINSLFDYTEEEFRSLCGCAVKDDLTSACGSQEYSPSGSPPASLDYRQRNMVTHVKNQGSCGSCYAFSSIGAIEGQYALKTNELISFSPQQIVDCDKEDKACSGGWMTRAFSYLMGGVQTDADYPYVGKVQACAFNSSKAVTRVSKCSSLSFAKESDMMAALAQYGPLSVGVNSGGIRQRYSGGIIKECGNGRIDHAVLLVGYGQEGNEQYWIIKNSWGSDWGESGYFRLKMGHNLCRITEGVVSVQL